MRESRPPGSVPGVLSNEHPYRDSPTVKNPSGNVKKGRFCPVVALFAG
jgi:hypothetical protein